MWQGEERPRKKVPRDVWDNRKRRWFSRHSNPISRKGARQTLRCINCSWGKVISNYYFYYYFSVCVLSYFFYKIQINKYKQQTPPQTPPSSSPSSFRIGQPSTKKLLMILIAKTRWLQLCTRWVACARMMKLVRRGKKLSFSFLWNRSFVDL